MRRQVLEVAKTAQSIDTAALTTWWGQLCVRAAPVGTYPLDDLRGHDGDFPVLVLRLSRKHGERFISGAVHRRHDDALGLPDDVPGVERVAQVGLVGSVEPFDPFHLGGVMLFHPLDFGLVVTVALDRSRQQPLYLGS